MAATSVVGRVLYVCRLIAEGIRQAAIGGAVRHARSPGDRRGRFGRDQFVGQQQILKSAGSGTPAKLFIEED